MSDHVIACTLSGVHVFQTADGYEWVVDSARLIMRGQRRVASRVDNVVRRFPRTQLSTVLLHHIMAVGPASLAGTLACMVRSCSSFLRYLERSDREDFSAEAFSEWLVAMQNDGMSEGGRRSYATHVIRLAEGPLVRAGVVSRAAATSARIRFRKHFRGFSRRALERLHDDALTGEEYLRLIRAARVELEESRAALLGPSDKKEAYPLALPLMPFVILAGAFMAVRASELNVLNVGDMREHDGTRWLHLHAPNKAPAQVPMHDGVYEALLVAQEWMAEYRESAAPDDPLLIWRSAALLVVRFDTIYMRDALVRFAEKWFGRTDANGRPILWREKNGVKIPMVLSVSALRAAGISEWARRERNPEKLRILARHRRIETTERYYIKQAHADYVDEWSRSLRTDVEMLRASMANAIAPREMAARAAALGALVEGGHCDEVMRGITSCDRAPDCRRCKNFRIHPDKREVFVVALERAIARAERAKADGLMRQVENYRGQAALNQAIIDRIDDYLLGLEDGA